MRSRPLT